MRKLLILAFILLSAHACRSHTFSVNVQFQGLSGLAKQDAVLFEKNTIGGVDTIHFNQDGSYAVRLLIDKGFGNAVTEYSRFVIVDDPNRKGHKAVEVSLTQLGGTPLPDGAAVTGTEPVSELGRRLQQDVEAGLAFFVEQIEKLTGDLKQVPQSDEYQRLKKELSDLADDMSRAGKKAREKLKDEWVPRLESEIENFKKRLEEFGREKEAEPLEKELERIRRI